MDSWDKVAGWILLFAFVLGGTQVLLAAHGRGKQDTRARQDGTQTTPLHDDSATSGQERKHWSAEPGCFEQASDIPDRTVSRSWTLASPDGVYKAYAVNEAIAERPGNEMSGCKSTSTLFVSGAGIDDVKVLVVEPIEAASGNSIELVDWSREGHRLLVIVGYSAWASDAGGLATRIYDADTRKVTGEDFVDVAFRQTVGRQCFATFDALGFSADGKVVVKAYPDLDEDQILQEDSCVKGVEVWALDTVTANLNRLPDDYKVKRYGKRAP